MAAGATFLLHVLLFVVCLFAQRFTAAAVKTHTIITVEVDSVTILNTVDSKFVSFTMDSHQLAKHWKDINLRLEKRTPFLSAFRSERLVNLTKFLTPAILRVGGTDSDVIEFSPNGNEEDSQNISDGQQLHDITEQTRNHSKSILVSGKDFLFLADFLKKTKVEFIYGLNVLRRMATEDKWNSTNAKELMTFLSANKVKVFGWELGNEPDSFQHVFNVSLKSSSLANDFNALRSLTRKYGLYKDSFLIGPDITRLKGKDSRSSRYLKGFLRHADADSVDMISFHQYYFDGRTAIVDDFLNVTIMNALRTEIARVTRTVNKFVPGKPIWIGETSSGWGGGCRNISDTFASSFLWLDKLGQAAVYGTKIVFRQTLIGGAYGLIDLQENPTPVLSYAHMDQPKGTVQDYFVSLLHKQLIGQRTLALRLHSVGKLSLSSGLRLYAHCTLTNDPRNGSVTVFGINVDVQGFVLKLPRMQSKIIQEYLIQAPKLTSTWASLNGIKLKLKSDGSLPPLNPITRKHQFYFPPTSIGFWTLPLAKNKLCYTE